MYITEDLVNTSLFTLVGIEGDDEVVVLDEVSSMSIDTKPIDWCVAIFAAPNTNSMRSIRGDSSHNLLGNLLAYQESWLDSNLDSHLVPRGEWQKGSSGIRLPLLGANTLYDTPIGNCKYTLDDLPLCEVGSHRITSKEVSCNIAEGWNKAVCYYGVSPFLGVGTKIPKHVNKVLFHKLCTLIDNPAGIHLIILGDCDKAQSLFGSGFWGLRQFMVDYLGIMPSKLSTPLSVSLPFKYSVHDEMPDLGIVINRYPHTEKDVCSYEDIAIVRMLDIMWSILYFDYAYLDADPVQQDCIVAGGWEVSGRTYHEKVPFNNPAMVLLIGKYTQHYSQLSDGGAYLPDVDVTHRVICRAFLSNYKQVSSFIEYNSLYSKCLSNMAGYSKAFAISIYRRTCSKEHIVMPPGKVYPKKTEVRREIAVGLEHFNRARSLTTYVSVFSHLWEKVLWGTLLSEVGNLTSLFSFLTRNYNIPLSTLLTKPCAGNKLKTTLLKSSLLSKVIEDTNSTFLTLLHRNVGITNIEFLGRGSIPTVKDAVLIMLDMYADQVVYALELDRYSVVERDSFDKCSFATMVDSEEFFGDFTRRVKNQTCLGTEGGQSAEMVLYDSTGHA